MDERCLFEQNTATANSFGELSPESWSTVATVWGALKWDSAIEKEYNKNETVKTGLTLVTRYRSDIANTNFRVTINSNVYDIEGYLLVGRKRYLEFKLKSLEQTV